MLRSEVSPAKAVAGLNGGFVVGEVARGLRAFYGGGGGEGPQPLRRCLFGGETLQFLQRRSLVDAWFFSANLSSFLSFFLFRCPAGAWSPAKSLTL